MSLYAASRDWAHVVVDLYTIPYGGQSWRLMRDSFTDMRVGSLFTRCCPCVSESPSEY